MVTTRHANVCSDPQPQWHRQRRSSPPPPSMSPSTTKLTDPVLDSLNALQSQFVAFQESLGNVNSDVKDALAQLHALHTAHSKTDARVAVLEAVIGVIPVDSRLPGHGTRARGRDGTVLENTLVQNVACMQSAIDQLLAREPQTGVSSRQTLTDRLSSSVSTSPSFSSSPVPTPESSTSTRPAYADASIQAHSPSTTSQLSYLLSRSDRHPSTLIPVGCDPMMLVRESLRPTTLTSGHTTRDVHYPNPTNTVLSHVFPAVSSSSDASVVSKVHAIQTLSSSTGSSIQSLTRHTLSLATEAIASPAEMGAFSDPHLSPASSSSSSASFTDASLSVSNLSTEPHAELHSEDSSGLNSNAGSITGDVNIYTPEPTPGSHEQSTPMDVGREGLPSVLPTPPFEAFTDTHATGISLLSREHDTIADRKLVSNTRLPHNMPVIPTPPFLTPEPSVQVQKDREFVAPSSLGASSDTSPLTPLSTSPPSPSVAAEGLPAREGVEDENGQSGTQAAVSSADAGPGTVHESNPTHVTLDIEASTSTANSGVSQMADDADLFVTPESSIGQPTVELPDCHPDANNANSPYAQMDGYDIRFSSPLRPSLATSMNPSRFATPSDSAHSRPAQEEEEVWGALMLSGSASGVSTPGPDSTSNPFMFSHAPVYASSASPASSSVQASMVVAPSMLHDPQCSPPRSDWSMSPLTSIEDTEGEQEEVIKRPLKKQRRGMNIGSVLRAAPEVTSADRRAGSRPLDGPNASLNELALLARRDPLKIHLKLPEKMRKLKRKWDTVEDGGEGNEGERVVDRGLGANVSVEDANPSQEKRKMQETTVVISASVPSSRSGAVIFPSKTPKRTVSRLAPKGSTSVDAVTGTGEPPGVSSYQPVPRKKTENRREDGTQVHAAQSSSHVSIRPKQKPKRDPKATSRPRIQYHVWNGQVVSIESDPKPTPALSTSPSKSQPLTNATSTSALSSHPEVTSHDLGTPTPGHRKKTRDTRTMQTPSSSPVRRPTSRNARMVKSSPVREGELHGDNGKWPKLPDTLSSWELQFIQCDKCENWYHYGCVAIPPGDPRLRLAALFICPKCQAQSARHLTLRHQGDTCARPDCPASHVTSETETFYVDKLVGRKAVGYEYMWLAKWEGYSMEHATWIPKENVVGDGTQLFDAFAEVAIKEGADLSQDVVLLREALEAGCNGDTIAC